MDPYKVLGVSPKDSDDKIKQAYRELARKYHPDKYANNPLADLAQDKMKEINEAYDLIMKQRQGGSAKGYYSGGSSGGYTSDNSGRGGYSEIRMLISMGRLDEAYRLLEAMTNRDAQWYFLMGSLYYKRGMYDQAKEHFNRAYQMEPGNMEYRSAVEQMNSAGGMYRTSGGMGGGNCSICDICAGAMCANCLCDCCGGGF